MSNGQQLEMVDGNLVEVRPAHFDVGDALVGVCVCCVCVTETSGGEGESSGDVCVCLRVNRFWFSTIVFLLFQSCLNRFSLVRAPDSVGS